MDVRHLRPHRIPPHPTAPHDARGPHRAVGLPTTVADNRGRNPPQNGRL